MAGSALRNLFRKITPGRAAMLVAAAFVAASLTLVISNLPQLNVVESALNDENFTDLVLQTRGELPIDTSIRVVTYDQGMLDSLDRVDRQKLALALAALLELEPRAVALDYLIEDERPEAPDGDAMLAALFQSHPNVIIGIFHEDSLNRFRHPPPSFHLRPDQLGCVNLHEDKDRSIRTYDMIWGSPAEGEYQALALRLSGRLDSGAAAYARSFRENTFVIDYAGGIGEQNDGDNGDAKQVFPAIPIATIYDAVTSGDSARMAFLRSQFAGKGVLVGYADIRNGQVTSIVDRFYTPLKSEKNSLPDMQGVAIHANILNTILERRVVQVMPDWANVIWGTALILLMLVGREFWKRIENPTTKAIAGYAGFVLLLAIAVMLPVLGFRYSPYKFSIYTPFAGLLLATPTIEVMDKGVSLLRDLRRRMWLRRPLPPRLREALRDILKPWSSEKRLEHALHFVQMQFHTACAVLFNEASERDIIGFDILCIASPTPGRVAAELQRLTALDQAPIPARQAAGLVLALNGDPVLREALRLSRSLYVATNEIRRQRAALDEEELESSPESAKAGPAQSDDSTSRYTDLMVKTLTMERNAEQEEEFNRLYSAIEAYAARAAEITGGEDPLPTGRELFPYAIRRRCTVHGREELFIYFNEQEDANNRDDFFDIVYGGETIACQPDEHPGLTKFREYVAQALAPGE